MDSVIKYNLVTKSYKDIQNKINLDWNIHLAVDKHSKGKQCYRKIFTLVCGFLSASLNIESGSKATSIQTEYWPLGC